MHLHLVPRIVAGGIPHSVQAALSRVRVRNSQCDACDAAGRTLAVVVGAGRDVGVGGVAVAQLAAPDAALGVAVRGRLGGLGLDGARGLAVGLEGERVLAVSAVAACGS